MKRLIILTVLFSGVIFAQRQAPRHTAFLEFGGQSFYYSLLYEYRLDNGLRLRTGFMALPSGQGTGSAMNFPDGISYVVGPSNIKAEIGVGLNFMFLGQKQPPGFDRPYDGFILIPALIFGLRYEPNDRGLFLRFTICDLFSKDKGIMNIGLSAGYSFHDLGFLFNMR